MEKRLEQKCALVGDRPTEGAVDNSTAGRILSTPSIPENRAQHNSHFGLPGPPRDTGLIAALERARCAYWQAYDRREFTQADAHAAHYRAILRRVANGAALGEVLGGGGAL